MNRAFLYGMHFDSSIYIYIYHVSSSYSGFWHTAIGFGHRREHTMGAGELRPDVVQPD